MKSILNFKEKGKRQLDNFKTLIDELQLQLALGKREAQDAFERERKTLVKFVNEEKALFKASEERAEEHEQNILDKLAALLYELDQEVPSGKRKFDSYKKQILEKIYALEYAIKTESSDVPEALQKKLDKFKTKLDAYRLQVAIGSYEDREKLETRKAELEDRINEIRDMVKDRQAEDVKWENFSEEISSSYNHLKKAFSDLLA